MISSNAAKIVAGVAIFLTVVLAFVGYRISRQYAENADRAQATVETREEVPKILAVVAVKPLAAYKEIEKDDVVVAEVSVAPQDYYTSLQDVVGKEPLVDVDQGAPVTQRYFSEGNVLAKSIPDGFKAISVEVSDAIGVGGFVRPGDVVDVLLYLRNAQDISESQARILLENIRVLSYANQLVDRPKGLKDDEDERKRSRRKATAVLAVPEDKTTRLMLGLSLGDLRLALYGAEAANKLALTSGGSSASAGAPALPLSDEALKAKAAKLAPDLALTAKQLSRVKPPPAKKRPPPRPKVVIYRGSDVESVRP